MPQLDNHSLEGCATQAGVKDQGDVRSHGNAISQDEPLPPRTKAQLLSLWNQSSAGGQKECLDAMLSLKECVLLCLPFWHPSVFTCPFGVLNTKGGSSWHHCRLAFQAGSPLASNDSHSSGQAHSPGLVRAEWLRKGPKEP